MKECQATINKGQYDYKAEKANQTPEQRHEVMVSFAKQYSQAFDAGVIDCAGKRKHKETGEIFDCPKRLMLIWMYRCWFCGRWFCPVCAKEHFGERK